MKTNAFEKMYAIVAKIPKGKVATYGQIARKLGINPRVVGFAMAANKDPQTIPCHRVVGKNGELTGYAFGGMQKKKEMLQKEGVNFKQDGTVNLKDAMIKSSILCCP